MSKDSKRINKGGRKGVTQQSKKKKSFKKTAEVNIPIFQSKFRKKKHTKTTTIYYVQIYLFNGCSYWSGSHLVFMSLLKQRLKCTD